MNYKIIQVERLFFTFPFFFFFFVFIWEEAFFSKASLADSSSSDIMITLSAVVFSLYNHTPRSESLSTLHLFRKFIYSFQWTPNEGMLYVALIGLSDQGGHGESQENNNLYSTSAAKKIIMT